jgi:hypothetical protein
MGVSRVSRRVWLRFSRRNDLISQHYGISKADLIAVIDLATSALDSRRAVPGQIHDNCPSCNAAFAPGRICNTVEWTFAPDCGRSQVP